jgi:hypothetical protein
MLMAWTFLYAASHQVFVPGWSVAGFVNKTKTFHDLFAVFTGPNAAPVVTFLVGYGHMLIGLSSLPINSLSATKARPLTTKDKPVVPLADAEDIGDARKGLTYAQKVCSGCHNVLRTDATSPNKQAPPFKKVLISA